MFFSLFIYLSRLCKRSCEQDAKQLFAAYCKHFHVDPGLFQGVFLIDFPEIQDIFEINIVVYELQDKKSETNTA